MKKILLSIVCLLAVTVKAAEISVGSQAELAALAGSSHADDIITLTADIALTFDNDAYWTPIGTFSTPFEGTFDGGGHTISGISIDYGSKAELAGLFGYVGTKGVVRNVTVSGNGYIYSNGDGENTNFVGAIAGYNAGTIQYCGNTAPVSAIHKHGRAGGIVGYNTGTVTGCYNMGTVLRSGADVSTIYIGGIAGKNDGGGTVSQCMSTNGIETHMTLANKSDNASTLMEHKGQTVNVLLDSRTLFADGSWNTLCLPFTIPAAALAGATVKEIDTTRSGCSGTTLTLYANAVTTVEAGHPYLVKWSAEKPDIANPCFQGVTIDVSNPDAVFTGGRFMGSFSPTTLEANNKKKLYVGSNNQLHWPTSNITMGSCRAYFLMDESIEGREVVLYFDDELPTSINYVPYPSNEEENLTGKDVWYTLSGCRQKVKPATKGIYIHQGRKEIVK